jgi:predicted deacylase
MADMTRNLLAVLLAISLCGCTVSPTPQLTITAPRLRPADAPSEPTIMPAQAAPAADSPPAPISATVAVADQLVVTQVVTQTAAPLPVEAADALTVAEALTGTEAMTAAETVTVSPAAGAGEQVIGYSVQGRPITATVFGAGSQRVALVGGIHGGYEWNTILFAYQLIDYLHAHPEAIPASLTVYVIPSVNPDGQALITGTAGPFTPDQVAADARPGRLNANGVDLNRNWDCHWNPAALWGETPVSGGSAPFSEPETQALRSFLTQPNMLAVIFWHSAAAGVFAGGCEEPYAAGEALGRVYAAASGYPFHSQFTSYTVTGDATDWLSLQSIPAITVEFYNHQDLDWEQNLAGTLASLQQLGAQPVADEQE